MPFICGHCGKEKETELGLCSACGRFPTQVKPSLKPYQEAGVKFFTEKRVIFEWRQVGDELQGFTIVAEPAEGYYKKRETKIFAISKRKTKFHRPRPWRLIRGGNSVEDFRSKKDAVDWAEKCLSSDVEIRRAE